MPPLDNLPVIHNAGEHRFEVTVDGRLAECDYVLRGDEIVFTHTYVPPELRGRGLAEVLVRAALEWAGREGRRVVPACSYVAVFIEQHREFQPLLAGREGNGRGGPGGNF